MCDTICRTKKAAGGRKGGTTTHQRHGSGHMSRIGKRGFSALAIRLGDGHKNEQAAIYVLAGKGKMSPYRALPATPWKGSGSGNGYQPDLTDAAPVVVISTEILV